MILVPQAYINKIMRHVAETLKYQLRGNDIVGRWSNLEFGIFCPPPMAPQPKAE